MRVLLRPVGHDHVSWLCHSLAITTCLLSARTSSWLLPLRTTRSLLTVCLQTVKYNMKKRAGRGFTLEELKVRTC